jgi:hypothetical protein
MQASIERSCAAGCVIYKLQRLNFALVCSSLLISRQHAASVIGVLLPLYLARDSISDAGNANTCRFKQTYFFNVNFYKPPKRESQNGQ